MSMLSSHRGQGTAAALCIERTKKWHRFDRQADKELQGVNLRMGYSRRGVCVCVQMSLPS